MAGEWIKFESNLPEKPETLAITTAMGWDDPDLTVGKLMRLFRWFDQHTVNGNAKSVTAASLDRIIGVAGFSQAVSDAGWLVIDAGGVSLEKFDRHNGQSAKSRSETAKRVANHRAKKASEAGDDEPRPCIPRPVRAAVLARDGNACVYCKRKEGQYGPGETARDGQIHLDHVIPVSQGGTDHLDNLVAACGPCNQFKSDRTPDECGLAWPMLGEKRAGNRKAVTPPLAREEKRERRSNTPKAPKGASERFPEFWLTWPRSVRKHDKAKCEEAWQAMALDLQAEAILADVRLKRGSPKWTAKAPDGNDFVEEPLKYLRNKRWEDGAEAADTMPTQLAGAV